MIDWVRGNDDTGYARTVELAEQFVLDSRVVEDHCLSLADWDRDRSVHSISAHIERDHEVTAVTFESGIKHPGALAHPRA